MAKQKQVPTDAATSGMQQGSNGGLDSMATEQKPPSTQADSLTPQPPEDDSREVPISMPISPRSLDSLKKEAEKPAKKDKPQKPTDEGQQDKG